MAATAIALTKIPLNGGVELPAAAALDGTAGAEIQFDGQDTKIVILIENGGSAAGDVTFKAGNGIQGVADLVVNVANGKTKAVVLESGAFKKAGKVYVTGFVHWAGVWAAGPRQAELDGVGRNICGANNRPRGFAERNGGRFKADKRREGAKAPF